jgi:MFS family permease
VRRIGALSTWGYPTMGGHRRLLVAVAVDTLGTGTWMPVSLLYFLRSTPLSLAEVGLALSVAALLALPLTAVAGQCVDRYGAKQVLQAGNVLQLVGFAAHPFVDSFAGVMLVAALAAVGRAAFWTSFGPLVAGASPPGERERWFGFLAAVRNVGFAVGALLGGVAISLDHAAAFQAVVMVNALSYLVSFLVMVGVRSTGRPSAALQRDGGGWRTVLSDRGYRWLLAYAFCSTLASMAFAVAVPFHVVEQLGLPGWLSGAVLVVNTLLVSLGQGRLITAMTGAMRSLLLVVAAWLVAGSYAVFWAAGTLGTTAGVVLVLLAAVVFTVGEMTADPVLDALAAETAPIGLRGRYLAAFQLTSAVATALAPALYGRLMGAGSTALWGTLMVCAVAAAACCVPLHRSVPRAATRITHAVEPDEATPVGDA